VVGSSSAGEGIQQDLYGALMSDMLQLVVT